MAEYTSIFGDLTQNVQIRFDKVSEHNKQLFDGVIFEKYLDWDVPSVGLNFEELIGMYNITVAAPTIGDNSKESILGSEGLSTVRETILNHAMTTKLSIQDYRKILQIIDSKSLPDKVKNQQLTDLMFNNVKSVVASVLAKLDTIFLGALSNEGVFTLDANNNPEGGVRGAINFNQPLTNIATTGGNTWTAGNLTTVDCLEDIQEIIEAASDKVAFGKILISPSKLSFLCRSNMARKAVWGTDKASKTLQINDLNEYMRANGLPIFEVVRRQVRIQDGSALTPFSPWNDNNVVFVPDGKLGLVKNAWANSELKPEPGVSYSNYGRIRVSQWGVGESQGSNGVEFSKAECFALPVITEMNGIYTLKTNV